MSFRMITHKDIRKPNLWFRWPTPCNVKSTYTMEIFIYTFTPGRGHHCTKIEYFNGYHTFVINPQ